LDRNVKKIKSDVWDWSDIAGGYFGRKFLLSYLLTQWRRVHLEKLTVSQLLKLYPARCSTRCFIIAFTIARHLSLFSAKSIPSTPPHHTSWRSIFYHPTNTWVFQVASFPQIAPPKPCIRLSSPPIRATWPAHLILLDLITRTLLGEQYRSLSSSMCNFLHSPVTSFLLDPNILLNTLFSNTLSLRSSHNFGDQVSYPNKTTGKAIMNF